MTPETHHLSRVVVADCGGSPVVFGPVHSERGLRDLRKRLETAGWVIHRDAKLVSLGQLKDRGADYWGTIARQSRDGIR
jgi:hypothetical protein